jgi:HSP20 family molecular chaperone IbpA
MSVEKASESLAASYKIAEKRKRLEDEENAIATDTAKAERARGRAARAEFEKTEKALVEISSAGERQAEAIKKTQTDRLRSINENSQKHYEKVAGDTAAQIASMEQEALKNVEAAKFSSMERVRMATDQTEDPFYRMKSLNPSLSEQGSDFVVKIALPEREAKNLVVIGEGQGLKVSLARRYQDKLNNEESNSTTRTSSYQSIVEQIRLPGPFDAKGIRQSYNEGTVEIRIPKMGFLA